MNARLRERVRVSAVVTAGLLAFGLLGARPKPAPAPAVPAPSASGNHDAGGAVGQDSIDAGTPQETDAEVEAGAKIWAGCIEHVPTETLRPITDESLPERGLAGHAIPLRVTVRHGKGETVFPAGFQVQQGTDTARALEEAGFWLPSPDGGSAPSITTRFEGDRAVTDVVIPFVALPSRPGRNTLVLPPLPIALARASGDIVTVCTAPHRLVVEDPIANEPDAAPRGNPPPRRQRELWTAARNVAYGLIGGAAAAFLITWLFLRWLHRPKPAAPPPSPRPPWELAFEEIQALRGAGLVQAGQLAEHVDRVSDITRRYLGLRYGFNGIESTTDEVLQSLGRAVPSAPTATAIAVLLCDCDLVKFARMAPTTEDCWRMLQDVERIVIETMPRVANSTARQPMAESPGVAP